VKGAQAVSAITRLIAAGRGRSRIDTGRCGETVARAYEAMGDAVAAAAVRQALLDTAGPVVATMGRGERDRLEWFEPTDLSGQLVLDGTTGAALERLVTELQQAHRLLAAGIDAPTRVLFSGPSGTGKTLAARWLGGRLGIPVAVLRISSVVSSHLGETGANLAKAFEATSLLPTVLFLDELDAICARRDGTGNRDVEEMARVTSTLLQMLDMALPGPIVIAATNFREKVDPALLRRLPAQIEFGLPGSHARQRMILGWWEKVPHEGMALLEAIERTTGRSGAETRALAMAAARAALLAEDEVTPARVRTAAAEMWPGKVG
jgi:SpoVK/Ycf46/Vps4 family AAA+-type ATPase